MKLNIFHEMWEVMKSLKKTYICIGIGILIFLLGCVVLSSMGKPLDKNATDTVIVDVEPGSGTAAIAQDLKDAELIKSTTNFRIISKIKGYDGKYKAGKYELSRAMSMKQMMQKIVEGATVTNSYTIPEGYTVEQIAELMESKGFCSKADFMHEVEYGEFDYDWIKYLPSGADRFEGVLFPSTYIIDIDADAHQIIDQILATFDSSFNEDCWDAVSESEYSFYEIMTVASIVEREARLDEDRDKVASVIYNRLDIEMKLQMCSTVQYILGEQKAVLTNSDIAIDDPYNTYLYDGLPPGPICSPGAESIAAALAPADTDYIYFVVSPKLDGSHNFSDNDEDFAKDKQAYKEALAKQQNEGN